MGREARAVEVPQFLDWKGGDDPLAFHSGRVLCWLCDNGNDHAAAELSIYRDEQYVGSLWLTAREWAELADHAMLVAASFREDDDDEEEA